AGEGVDAEDIEIVGRLPFQREPGIAKRDARIARASEIVEDVGRDISHIRIDLIEAKLIARPRIARNRSGAEPDGAGTIAGYARPGDQFRFYEINPYVRNVATNVFHYLGCARDASVALGDARLTLEREPPNNFDILAVDAFSSDAIPVHLLTREAFDLYWKHIRPGGILAVHVTNTFVDLAPIVAAAAAESGKTAQTITALMDDERAYSLSIWVLVADDPKFFDRPAFQDAFPIAQTHSVRPWTDDYSNLWRALHKF